MLDIFTHVFDEHVLDMNDVWQNISLYLYFEFRQLRIENSDALVVRVTCYHVEAIFVLLTAFDVVHDQVV